VNSFVLSRKAPDDDDNQAGILESNILKHPYHPHMIY
jgi:hypothetical protein